MPQMPTFEDDLKWQMLPVPSLHVNGSFRCKSAQPQVMLPRSSMIRSRYMLLRPAII